MARNIEENKNLLRLLDFSQENMFYAMYKKDGESEIDAKKRFFKSLPEATGGLRLLQKANSVLLQQFDKICKKFDLPYFFCGGNLVGAVRTVFLYSILRIQFLRKQIMYIPYIAHAIFALMK